jgi:GcrA cell cycle regulator
MAWSDEDDERLAALWAEGLSGVAIGKAMGRTKSACLGRVHRLNLTPRPSPLPGGDPGHPRITKLKGAGAVKEAVAMAMLRLPPEPERAPPGRPRQRLSLWLVPTGVVRECQWPHGTPGKASFYLCGDPAWPSRPYCERHCRRAFLGWRAQGYAQAVAS